MPKPQDHDLVAARYVRIADDVRGLSERDDQLSDVSKTRRPAALRKAGNRLYRRVDHSHGTPRAVCVSDCKKIMKPAEVVERGSADGKSHSLRAFGGESSWSVPHDCIQARTSSQGTPSPVCR